MKLLKRPRLKMKSKLIALAALALLLVSAFGCAPASAPESGTEMDSEISGLDNLDAELDMSELEELDKEFAELESLFS